MVNARRQIIVGDVGGTNVRFAIADLAESGVVLRSGWRRPGAGYASFLEALDGFLREHDVDGELAGAALGFAGPVAGQRVELLHRDWVADAEEIGARLSSKSVLLVNDFVAMARSAPELAPDALDPIAPGKADQTSNIVVGGPGTGFGLGTLKRSLEANGAGGWLVVGGEGGHQLFAPQTDLEWRIAERLREAGVYVSNEVIASGSGLKDTLSALADVMKLPIETDDPATVVDRARRGDPLCVELCHLRARCTMSALGDAALAANATGGVFIAGGVSGHLAEWLREPVAIARFRERGARSELLSQIPLNLIRDDSAALLGAAALWSDKERRGWI